jgi:predicted metal-dependent phosphoesterase TrpH
MKEILELLNTASSKERLENLDRLLSEDRTIIDDIPVTEEVNNHVHTIYSFSPYSPTAAAFMARRAGLQAVGCIDHDSISGGEEMLKACRIIGMGSTVGCELRVNFSGTKVEGRKINSPDSNNIAYIVIHGVPAQRISELQDYLNPINLRRNERNQRQVNKLNSIITPFGIEPLDFEEDVYPLSEAPEGGSITERHILKALCLRILHSVGKGEGTVRFLEKTLGIDLADKIRTILTDEKNPHYIYDLLGVLKSNFLGQFFIQPDYKECISVFEVVEFANSLQAIPAYAYLGDVTESPTGDKKAEKFEDAFLDILMPELKKIGFRAITYMPPRNTKEQLKRIRQLCSEYELMEISGVDINSSRQSFNCPEILHEDFHHLIDATWALIAHEKAAAFDESNALFNDKNPHKDKKLAEKIEIYNAIGRNIDYRSNPLAGFFEEALK